MVNGMNHVLLIAAAASLAIVSACSSTPPSDQGNACSIFEQNRSWYRATRKAEKKWKVPIALQLAFIKKESSFDKTARPERSKFLFIFPGKRPSSAKGYAQALDTTWQTYKNSTGKSGASRKNFSDAADFIGWYVSASSKRTGVARNDAYNQYLAYHEGAGGYLKGSWRRKPAVKRRASVVAAQAARYESQLKRCEKKFRRGIPLVPFI